MPETVVPFEWTRLLWGDVPLLFLAEILFRTIVIYAYSLAALRVIGGRSVAQMSLVEFLLVIALGSAVGDGMFYPDVPLIHAILVVTLVVAASKGIDMVTLRFRRAKHAVDGGPVEVVRDGAICLDGIAARDMGPTELAAFLRVHGVTNLGQVRAAYLEPMGQLSVFRADRPRPGLRIEPPVEIAPYKPPGRADTRCCGYCGAVAPSPALERCAACNRSDWTLAEMPDGMTVAPRRRHG